MASLPYGVSNLCINQEVLSSSVRILPVGRRINGGARAAKKVSCKYEGHGLSSPVEIRERQRMRCKVSSNSTETPDDSAGKTKKTPFGYTRKDVLLIGVGVTALGIGLESELEYVGVDPLQAGNAVQLIMVLGLTLAWISTYIFRVGNKEMTYAQQLRDYESQVMQVPALLFRGLLALNLGLRALPLNHMIGLAMGRNGWTAYPEAELEVLMEQVDEEKRPAE